MTPMRTRIGQTKGLAIRGAGALWARAAMSRHPTYYTPGATVVIVTWNSLPYLRRTLEAVREMSPPDTQVLVVDNHSEDGTREYLDHRTDVRTLRLPVNVGHGVALDLAVPRLSTEIMAVLDVDAFPVSQHWLSECIAALDNGAHVAGAHLHRNFVHPCFLVTRTSTLHRYGLTFRPVGSLSTYSTSAPLFLDVAEALAQRLIVKFGGGQAVHFFEPTSVQGPGMAGTVFGGLVYHNMYATQGVHRASAEAMFQEAFDRHHPELGAAC